MTPPHMSASFCNLHAISPSNWIKIFHLTQVYWTLVCCLTSVTIFIAFHSKHGYNVILICYPDNMSPHMLVIIWVCHLYYVTPLVFHCSPSKSSYLSMTLPSISHLLSYPIPVCHHTSLLLYPIMYSPCMSSHDMLF